MIRWFRIWAQQGELVIWCHLLKTLAVLSGFGGVPKTIELFASFLFLHKCFCNSQIMVVNRVASGHLSEDYVVVVTFT